MGTKRKKAEILSPAGSMQALKAAIMAGCDAVYIGGTKFGARAYAENPDEITLLDAVDYCHMHKVKIYLTVNTLLKNQELKELYTFLLPFYQAGGDAVLVQDFGVLSFIHHYFPDLPVHASTQMSVIQGSVAEFLKKYHVTRIVPARELTLPEIQELRKDTDLELEVFVHGALCYCYSGRCLFSSMLGDRSGNRGRCAQSCRQRYEIGDGRTKKSGYFLSLKELCNLPVLSELLSCGIDSLKIEGRMKRPEYAALVTSIYRKYVDLFYEHGKEGYHQYIDGHQTEWKQDILGLMELYNREGFTDGYLRGEAGDRMSRHPGQKGTMLADKRPGHGGVFVGKVLSVGKSEAVYQSFSDLGAHDVVEFRDKNLTPVYEYTLGADVKKGKKVRARYKKGAGIIEGDLVYRIKNDALLSMIQKKYLEKTEQIPVIGSFYGRIGEKAVLRAACGDVSIAVEGDMLQPAKNQPVSEQSVRKVLTQTGESSFYFTELDIFLEESGFLSVGGLKKLRRQAFQELTDRLLEKYHRPAERDAVKSLEQVLADGSNEFLKKSRFFCSASVFHYEQLEKVVENEKIGRVYLYTECFDKNSLKQAFFLTKQKEKSPWLAFPMIFRKDIERVFREEWNDSEGIFSVPWEGFLVNNLESYLFVKEMIKKTKYPAEIALDSELYMMNGKAYEFFAEDMAFYTIPFELTWKEMWESLCVQKGELVGYGRVPLMVSAQCVQANTEGCVFQKKGQWNREINLKDSKRRRFQSVNYCQYCYNVIYQEEPVDLSEVLEQRKKYPVGSYRYAFTTETGKETEEILRGNIPFKTGKGHFYKEVL